MDNYTLDTTKQHNAAVHPDKVEYSVVKDPMHRERADLGKSLD